MRKKDNELILKYVDESEAIDLFDTCCIYLLCKKQIFEQ